MDAPPGGWLLFADGLRCVVARRLQMRLAEMGITGSPATPDAHGGINLLECLTPVLEVSRGSASSPRLPSPKSAGMARSPPFLLPSK